LFGVIGSESETGGEMFRVTCMLCGRDSWDRIEQWFATEREREREWGLLTITVCVSSFKSLQENDGLVISERWYNNFIIHFFTSS
jgi:hypothetical protein